MKGAKFKKERQAVYAAIGRLKVTCRFDILPYDRDLSDRSEYEPPLVMS